MFFYTQKIFEVFKKLFFLSRNNSSKYDSQDILLGHGTDNLPTIRLIFFIALVSLVIVDIEFIYKPSVSAMISFIVCFLSIIFYVNHLPLPWIQETKDEHNKDFLAYFGGRILFTPKGLILSRKCQRKQNTLTSSKYGNADKNQIQESYLQPIDPNSTCDAQVVKSLLNVANSKQKNPRIDNAGFINSLNVPSMAGRLVYAGVPMALEDLNKIFYAYLETVNKDSKSKKKPSDFYCLGFGFKWLPKHTRKLDKLIAIGLRSATLDKQGSPDIHGVEENNACEPIFSATRTLVGHTLVLGTTGAGKTRTFDLLVSQAIMRGDSVIIIDPKGDDSLQQCILRAARTAGREPFENIYCLDIGRSLSSSLSSAKTQNFAQISEGQLHPFGSHNLVMGDERNNIQPRVFTKFGQNSMTRSGHNSFTDEECLTSTDASLRAQSLGYLDPVFGSDLQNQEDSDNAFYDYINRGFNPASAFDRSTEVADRLTAMMPKSGTAASFQAYSNVAIAAAVECLLLTGQKVNLVNIRSIIVNHEVYITTLRSFLNRTVVELNCAEASLYFNNLHGIKNTYLKRNCYAVTVLLGENATGSVSTSKEEKVVATLEKSGLLNKSEIDFSSGDDLPPGVDDATNEETSAKSNTKKTTTAKKITRGPHTASIHELYNFYEWLIKKGLVKSNSGVDKIFGIATLAPDYFKKVTNGILPYLSALTSGDLTDLLSNNEEELPTFFDIIRNNKIFYAALHCLKDSATGQALGKLLIADLAFLAGKINAKKLKYHQVSIFIDETSEVANESLVQLLNKSRSSNFAVTIATQSVADLALRAGSMEAANQIIANCNNVIALRVNDPSSANVIASMLPETVVSDYSTTISFSDNVGDGNAPFSTSRTLMQRKCELFSSSLLRQLPDLEFVALLSNGNFYKGFIPTLTKSQDQNLTNQNKKAQEVNTQSFADISDDLSISQADPSLRQQVEDWQEKVAQNSEDQEVFLKSILSDSEFGTGTNNLSKVQISSKPSPKKIIQANINYKTAGTKSSVLSNQQPKEANFTKIEQKIDSSSDIPNFIGNQDRLLFQDFDDQDYINGTFAKAASYYQTNKLDRDYLKFKQDQSSSSQPTASKSSSKSKKFNSKEHHILNSYISYTKLKFESILLAGVKGVLSLFLSMRSLCFYRICWECLVFLVLSFVVSWSVSKNSSYDLIESLELCMQELKLFGSSIFKVITGQAFYLEDLGGESPSFFHNLALVFSFYIKHWILIILLLTCGMLFSHIYVLVSEVKHKSIIGVVKFTELSGFPFLCLIGVCLYLLWNSFIFSVEISRIVLGAWFFLFAFNYICFYNQHSK